MPAYLLDKSVARRILEGLARVRRRQLLYPEQVACLTLLYAEVEVIQVTRYTRRWARRLREHGFTREDAVILSLGTFGAELS